jgi:hypothetical protein
VLPRVDFLGIKLIFGILELEPRLERDSPSSLLKRDPGLSKSAKLGIKGLRLVWLPEAFTAPELELGLEFISSSTSEGDVSPRESAMGMKRSFIVCTNRSRAAFNCMDDEVAVACETGSGGLEFVAGRSILEGGVSNEASSVICGEPIFESGSKDEKPSPAELGCNELTRRISDEYSSSLFTYMALGLFEGPCHAIFRGFEGLGGKRQFGGTSRKSSFDTHASSSILLMYSSSCELRDFFNLSLVVSSIALGQPEFDGQPSLAKRSLDAPISPTNTFCLSAKVPAPNLGRDRPSQHLSLVVASCLLE